MGASLKRSHFRHMWVKLSLTATFVVVCDCLFAVRSLNEYAVRRCKFRFQHRQTVQLSIDFTKITD